MSASEIKRCYKELLKSIEGKADALVWATNLQSEWIEFIESFLNKVFPEPRRQPGAGLRSSHPISHPASDRANQWDDLAGRLRRQGAGARRGRPWPSGEGPVVGSSPSSVVERGVGTARLPHPPPPKCPNCGGELELMPPKEAV